MWTATRLGMTCQIPLAAALERIDNGGEQIDENTFLCGAWLLVRTSNDQGDTNPFEDILKAD